MLAPDARATLNVFLESHGAAFRASVLMLRKRRLDNILDALTVTSLLFSEYELSCYWDDYLASIANQSPTPKNPLLESVAFGRFLIETLPADDPHVALVEYDVTRNGVAAAAAASRYTLHESPERGLLLLHPASQIVGFLVNVACLVKAVTSGMTRNAVLDAIVKVPERILFFKNWKRGGVGTLKLGSAVEKSLELFDGRYSHSELLNRHPHLSTLVASLLTAGVLAPHIPDAMHEG
ncbi:hypothetical protein [Xanthomonas phaseoli]|uniref:hypothetical protein n=1 Tax=Xanthomonas phaseoli TaxID=1985254 RepID=UPI001E5E3BC5|nr:hypothetical protein [Xanthomonas phaseoli]MCC8469110.1 hypothetical protein [Xanthomonas phaseoli]